MKWFEHKGDMDDIVISTRIRLARNLKGLPFTQKISKQDAEKIIDKVFDATKLSPFLSQEFSLLKIERLKPYEAESLVERHLISPALKDKSLPRAVILSSDEGLSIMINEEDHLRIQVMGSGLCLEKCMEDAIKIDTLFEERLNYAFSEEYGYLTHCPTNLGTGLRASAMLHLPMLKRNGVMDKIISATGKIGLAVRGIYGEGTAARGDLYQVSNQLTLGFAEHEIITRLKQAVLQIISNEKELRKNAWEKYKIKFDDAVWRSAGVLTSARTMSSEEAARLLSDLRLGVSQGTIKGIDLDFLNRLMYEVEPANILQKSGTNIDQGERDVFRADFLRRALNEKLKDR